jgi:hypothetical protein
MVTAVSKQVIAITEEYLGPAAERFIERITTFHLNKSADELTARDVRKLTEWIKVSLGLLTSDKTLVDDCVRKLLKLAR